MFILFKENFEFDPRKVKSIAEAYSSLKQYDEVPVAFSENITDLFSKIPESPYLHRYSYKLCEADVFFIDEYDWYFSDSAFDINSLSDLKSALCDMEFKDRHLVFASEDLFSELKERYC